MKKVGLLSNYFLSNNYIFFFFFVESPEKSPKSRHQAQVKKPKPELPKEAQAASKEFATFLNQRLERKGVSDISKQVNEMVEKILSFPLSSPEHVDELSATIQEFYQNFNRRLETSILFKNTLSDDDKDKIMDLAEKYITIRCYKSLFCPNVTCDEEKDLELQNRIRTLNWISTEHLNASIDEFSQTVRDLLYQAINDLLEMDGKMTPQDKMASLVKSSKNIFEILKLSNESPASADDFLPCLIYICLKANPPRIQSNINYITRFCNENKLRMGEGGYFFANLCCAMSFIENLKAESVNMDPEEFEDYVSGRSVPLESWRSNLLMCDGLQKMSQNLKILSELKSQQEQILQDALKLKEAMDSFNTEIEREVVCVLERTQYEIKKRDKEPVDLDAEEEVPDALPAPLLPMVQQPEANGKVETINPTLEDYLSTSDSMSLLSLDMSSVQGQVPESENDLNSYRGFSAQSFSIPSISCDSALPTASKPSTSSSENVESTASSSPIISVPTSPDEVMDHSTPKKSSSDDDDNEPTAAKVLSGIFETFDNLI